LSDKEVKCFHGISSFSVSSIWWARNSIIFKKKDIPLEVTAGIILNLSKEFMRDLKIKDPRFHVMPELDFVIPWGCFDGACQVNPPICGVGEVIYLKKNNYIQV
jgi:hypothetical protein